MLRYGIEPDTLIIPEEVLMFFDLCDVCEIMGMRVVIIKCPAGTEPLKLINFGYMTKGPLRK